MKVRIKIFPALLSLLLVACMGLLATSCSDDDEPATAQTYEWGFKNLQASTPEFLSDMNKITDAFKSALGATGDATTVTKKGAAEKTDAEVREACQKAFDSLKDEVWQGHYTFIVTNITTGNAIATCTFSANDSNFASLEYFEVNGIRYAHEIGSNDAKVVENNSRYSGSVVIPAHVTHEGIEYAVTAIDDLAFSGCISLTSITLPESVTNIGWGAFNHCRGLTTLTLPDNITDIGECAFQNCTHLETLTIPKGISTIGESTFMNCSSLWSVTIPDNVKIIGEDAFYLCVNLRSLSLGNGVTTIEDGAFSDCRALSMLSIPDSVTRIGNFAFLGCNSLVSVKLGNDLSLIDSGAFSGCRRLMRITCSSAVPAECSDTSFDSETFSSCVLEVPTGTKATYANAGGWKNFKKIQQPGEVEF